MVRVSLLVARISKKVIENGDPYLFPDKVRPYDQMFGIDVYKTARNLGLPCEVLQNKNDIQNRYGFVLID